jgi:hypothetical protein
MASDRRGERGIPAHPLGAEGRRRGTGRGGGLDGAGRRGGVVGPASLLMEIDGLWGGGGILCQIRRPIQGAAPESPAFRGIDRPAKWDASDTVRSACRSIERRTPAPFWRLLAPGERVLPFGAHRLFRGPSLPVIIRFPLCQKQ